MKAAATATLTSKGQITIPARICRTLGLKKGQRVDVFPLPYRAGFEVIVRRPSRILDFAGDLKDWKEQPSD